MGIDAVVWVADGETSDGRDYGHEIESCLAEKGIRSVRKFHYEDDEIIPARYHFLTGGETSVNDKTGWMPKALQRVGKLLEDAEAGNCTVFGICLGSQMIAESLWPGSVRSGSSIEVGLAEIEWNLNPSLPTIMPTFHYEEIDGDAVRAGGGSILAQNSHSEVQAFCYGNNIFGTQFHPELTPEGIRKIVNNHGGVITEYGGSVTSSRQSVLNLADRWNPDTFSILNEAFREHSPMARL